MMKNKIFKKKDIRYGDNMKKSIMIFFTLIIIIALLYIFSIRPHKQYSNSDFNIKTYISDIDKDNDGIDDQTDILNNARAYIKTKPKYKSKYYKKIIPIILRCKKFYIKYL